ncbi:MAG: xanthine dehydrogenase family protein molybdopterin-binding subunit [Hyphomicrobiales bacterium]|nr:xanthine dehydrogenase family protein molybdopterin-binding subunit [Hyphomicrobiales bacterium]
MSKGIGQPVRRKEDARLVVGGGCFSDDVDLPRQARAFVLRSVHAHARIRGIDTIRAKATRGVLAVLTGADLAADAIKPIPPDASIVMPPEAQRKLPDVVLINKHGPYPQTPFNILAIGRVRYVGEAVVLVVAETLAIAKDAAEKVDIDYEPLPSVTATTQAAETGAVRLYDDSLSNVFCDAEVGNAEATARAFAGAAHVVRLRSSIQRVTGVPMEARTAVGHYDRQSGRYFLHAGSGGVVRQKGECAAILGVAAEQVQVVARDIGGNFGTKNSLFPEFPLVLWASRRISRPVKWTCERSEAFLSDYQGRDLVADIELAIDHKGRFLAMRGSHLSNIGSHAASIVPLRKGLTICTGVYRIPFAHLEARAVLSNSMCTIPYRSAGRPEATYLIERLCDLAAERTGIDRIAIRRRNLVSPKEMPYRTALGTRYDNGEYERAMDFALSISDWKAFAKRRRESRRNGRLRGIGLANYIECTMGYPREWSKITVKPEGEVEVAIGTLSSGQGHETSFAQCVSEWLGVAFEQIRLVQGDTDIIPVGGGSHSGRSMRFASIVMGTCSNAIIARSKRIAARMLETDADAVEFKDGRFRMPGTTRSFDLFEIARAAQELNDLDDDLRGPLSAESDQHFTDGGYPYGCAVCEVEIDRETGAVEIVRYSAVDDVGRAVNPMILHGQTHGAIAQGVGQALWEHCILDRDSGQVMTGSFMDYAMPRADVLPSFRTELMEVPSPTNPLGVRAGGEGGTTPALGAVVNAVVDALREYGVTHLDMPLTSEKVWRAIRDRKRA